MVRKIFKPLKFWKKWNCNLIWWRMIIENYFCDFNMIHDTIRKIINEIRKSIENFAKVF